MKERMLLIFEAITAVGVYALCYNMGTLLGK